MQILTSGTNVSYKLDTGSQVNIIPQKTYHALQKKPKLYTATEKLMAYDGNAIPVNGKCVVNLARKGKPSIPAQMFVVPTDSSPTRVKIDQVDATLFAEQRLNNVVIKVQQHLLN